MNDNNETVYAGFGCYVTRDKTTHETIQFHDYNSYNPKLLEELLNLNLGDKAPYFRFVEFPVEVTTEIELKKGEA